MDGVYVEISMNPNDQYRLWTFVFLIRLTEQSVNHHLREFNIPQKNTNELGPAWHIAGNHRIRERKKIAFNYSDPGRTLENKLNDLKPLFLVARRALLFKRGQRKCSCVGGQILPTRINNNHWKLIYVSRTIPFSQYEKNLWSTHVNIVRLAEPIRRCVRWRTQVFKIEGFVCKRFLPSPPPPPFSFFGSCFISRAAKTENPVPPSFFAPKPHGNACYAGYPIMLPDYCHLWLGLTGRFIFHTVWRQIERC